ncbi:hypothetical protein GM920_16870 [Pedobacter sp. LMG 31462]|uniref:Uncharacterized protein n=1 Tax=Pedobacter gandavensis TaxID=2679963 RepID=A0ABR6EZ65_9SPHI|nr:hypothetical protein [Pedobacter gandavensis]
MYDLRVSKDQYQNFLYGYLILVFLV